MSSPEEFKDYYRRWLKVLEGHYMTLFKSPEYTRTMSHTLNALEDFTLAKQELLAEALEALPIPTHRDMDELYREVYLLKKQVKDLSKKMAGLAPFPGGALMDRPKIPLDLIRAMLAADAKGGPSPGEGQGHPPGPPGHRDRRHPL